VSFACAARARSWASALGLLFAALAFGACGPRAHSGEPPTAANACARCHMPEYLEAKQPVHVGVRPTACAVCHSQRAWAPSVFDHPWPLTGAHAGARCAGCHVGQPPLYVGTSKLCVGCHRDDYDRSDYPGHERFARTCADCHSTTAWKPARKPPAQSAAQDEVLPRPSRAARGERTPQRVAPGASESAAPPRAAAVASLRAERARDTHPAAELTVTDEPSQPSAPESQPSVPAPVAELPSRPAAAPAVHPEGRFPIKTGAHEGIGCRTCHDQGGSMGKDDTDCVQCHARAKYDRIHDGVRDYPQGAAPLNFCLSCHASGSRARRR
jgi:hypothetical protein